MPRSVLSVCTVSQAENRKDSACRMVELRTTIFFHALGTVATVLATVWMYAFGTCDPAEMKYLLGMPMWISGAILIYLVMFVIGIIRIAKWEEFPLTAREKKEEKK